MKRSAAILLLALAAGLPVSSWAYPMPASSADRAARYEEWRTRLDRADQAADRGDWTSAETTYESVVDEGRDLDDRSLLLARALDGLGMARARAGRLEDAARLYDEAARLFGELLGPRQPRVAVTLANLGIVYREMGRVDEARDALERALAIFENGPGARSDAAESARRALSELATGSAAIQLEPDVE